MIQQIREPTFAFAYGEWGESGKVAASQLPLSLSLSFLPGPVAVAHPSAAWRQLSDWPTLSTTDEGGSGEPKKTQKGG